MQHRINSRSATAQQTGLALARALAVGSVLGLIVLGLAWELRIAPIRPGGSWLALKVLPLCLPLAGLLKNRLYTFRWVSLLVWVYVAEALVRATTEQPPAAWLAWAELALCLILFIACSVYVRRRLKHVPRKEYTHAQAA